MNTLVIGYGSIGSRHVRLLKECGHNVSVVSQRKLAIANTYDRIEAAFYDNIPDYIVIANRTSEHRDAFYELKKLDYKGTVLIEKPLFEKDYPVEGHEFKSAFVGYDMRFHPLLQRLRDILQSEFVISVQAYVGQYLPGWRPQTDYKECYSAQRHLGGGVLRDLSHEIDYLNWMLGGWKKLVAQGGRYSNLEIDSDDVFSIMFAMQDCPIVNLQMNYLDRHARRFVLIQTKKHSYYADFISGNLMIDDDSISLFWPSDEIYKAEHFAAMHGDDKYICTLEQGAEVMKIVEAAEKSSREGGWIFR